MKYEHRTAEQAGTRTYADGSGNTLIFLDLLALLDFGPSRVVDLLHPRVLLATTELWSINSNEKTFDTSFLCMLNVLLGDFTVPVDIPINRVSSR